MPMLTGCVATVAHVHAYASEWGTSTVHDPSPKYLATRTVIAGICVEVWAATENDGNR